MECMQGSVKTLLQHKYEELRRAFGAGVWQDNGELISVIKKVISGFMKQCNTPAIWCYGIHTKMLMADFMFELKKVRYIIDNGNLSNAGYAGSGFEIIRESGIEDKKIDGIIISSRTYRDEIVENLKSKYPHVPYLDIYHELEKAGIQVEGTYYEARHPYTRYCRLNRLQRGRRIQTKI